MAAWFFALLTLGLMLLWLGRRGWARSGLPQGRIVYADTGGWKRPERALFSHELLLTGKPDYVVADGTEMIPIELKSGSGPPQPYPSHLLQLAAYCRLVEERYGQRPSRGIIKYADTTFEVDYTPELEEELLTVLDEMRADLADGEARRNHHDPRRCRACGYYQHCDQRVE